jgi:branched-chain amino acid transport system substrate-binding protein
MSVSRKAAIAAGGASVAMLLAVTANATAAPTPKPTVKPVACATEAGVDNSTIKVGLVTIRTGAAATTQAGFYEAAKLRMDQENAKGGVNGRKITLSLYDDKGSGSEQTVVATKAVSQDGVFGLLEGTTADTMFPYLKQNNIPTVGLTNLPAHNTDRNVFGATGAFTNIYSATYGAQRLMDTGTKNFAVVNHNSPGANSAGSAFSPQAASVGGNVVLRIADAPIGSYDATSTALKVKQSGAEASYLVLTPDGGVSVMQALKQQGVAQKGVIIAGLSDPAVVAKAPAALEGAIGGTYGNVAIGVAGKPGLRTFTNGMKAAGLNPYAPGAPIGFIAADTFIKGLKLAGKCPTRQGFIDQLRNQSNITGAGLLPQPISYKPGLYPNGDPAVCGWYMTVKNGVLVPDAKATCGKIIENATGKVVK